MHKIFDNKSPRFIFQEPESNFLWHGRMIAVLSSFDKETINKAISLDKASLGNVFDLSLFYKYAHKTNNEYLLQYFHEIPGTELNGNYTETSQFHHLLSMNQFAAIIYFYQDENIQNTNSTSAISFIYDKINNLADFKKWFKEIVDSGHSHKILRADFNF